MAAHNQQFSKKPDHVFLVSAPAVKFFIGSVAALCAVFSPRLIAALALPDRGGVTFISTSYALLALLFALLMGLVIAVFEWRVPRTPRDTFMTTLGIPAILAGALTANQTTVELQKATKAFDDLAKASGIPIEPASTGATAVGKEGFLRDLLVTPVYAEGAESGPPPTEPTQLGISINQPRYFVVLDRAKTQGDAQARLSNLNRQLAAAAPGPPPRIEIKQQATEFLIVLAGGPMVKSTATVEAAKLKNTYRLSPSLVEAPKA